MIKQVIVIRTDLNMRKGKMVAQGAHASMKVFLERAAFEGRDDEPREFPFVFSTWITKEMMEWLDGTFTKICVGVESEETFKALARAAKDAGLPVAGIQDNGLTEFHGVKTWTALAIGPAESEDIDKITGHLKLL